MKNPIQVGITGGIGSGKSLICKMFSSLGIACYDADSRAKILMTTDRILVDQIKKEFGNLSYHKDETLNREYLRQSFGDPLRMRKLNELVHPRVAIDYENWLAQQSGSKYVIKEAALLIESGSADKLNHLIVVYAPKSIRIQRVLKRDAQRTLAEVEDIMSNQMDDEQKMEKADSVILNDESRLVIPQVLELHERFISMN
ncbi:MAG TPA: dephospho-CoA kinase [Cyclobacteriaceae bacterium]